MKYTNKTTKDSINRSKTKHTDRPNINEKVEGPELLCIADWNVKYCKCFRNKFLVKMKYIPILDNLAVFVSFFLLRERLIKESWLQFVCLLFSSRGQI